MQEIVGKALLITLTLFMISLMADTVIYGIHLVKAQNFATNVVAIAEKNGGFQYTSNGVRYNMIPKIEEELKKENMSNYSYEYTKGRVEYNKTLTFTLRAKYNFFAFKLLGADKISAPIWSSRTGLGQVYFRD